MTFQHEITKKYRKKEIIPVCVKSWEYYKANKIDTLCVRIDKVWFNFKPPLPREKIEEYRQWSHTISPEAKELYYNIKYNCHTSSME